MQRLKQWAGDIPASVVVFLVALPLCMGIAIASGVPPALGLITGIIGGLVVGLIAGSPLQVSGPAAGLAVLVLELVTEHGIGSLGAVVMAAGLFQILAGVGGVGQWFRAISPAVIHGMLAGIGVLILASQFHVMLDAKPPGSGLANLLGIPGALADGVLTLDGSVHQLAAMVGLITIVVIVLWNAWKPASLKMLPGPLIAIVIDAIVVYVLGWQIRFVEVPSNLIDAANWPTLAAFNALSLLEVLKWGFMFAFVASAETLLCAAAVDRMHDGPRTRFNQEMGAQGVGNFLCGIFGALPMTGVIVRSSANVQAGARTRASAVLHGLWLLAFVVALPQVLNLIPTSGLAAILVYTGYKLVNLGKAREIYGYGLSELGIYAATLLGIVTVDLLTGVLLGLALALLKIVYVFAHIDIRLQPAAGSNRVDVFLGGSATFLAIPRLSDALASIPAGAEVHVHLKDLLHIDHACLELLGDWERRHAQTGGALVMEWQELRSFNRTQREQLADRSLATPPA